MFDPAMAAVINGVREQHSDARKEQNEILIPVTEAATFRGYDLAKQ
jgi:hypothetical protein